VRVPDVPQRRSMLEQPSPENLLMAAAIMDQHGKLPPPPPVPQDPQKILDQNRMQNIMQNFLTRQPKR